VAGKINRLELTLNRPEEIGNSKGKKLPKLYTHTFVFHPAVTSFDDIVFNITVQL